jgi:hypothetical protein
LVSDSLKKAAGFYAYAMEVKAMTIERMDSSVARADWAPSPPGKPSRGGIATVIAAPDYQELRSQLESNRERWQAAGIEDYSIILHWSYLCDRDVTIPIRISVKHNAIEQAAYVRSFPGRRAVDSGRAPEVPAGTPVPQDTHQYIVKSIPDLFDYLADAIAHRTDRIYVRYHPDLGYPLEASVEYSGMTFDDEEYFSIREFKQGKAVAEPAVTHRSNVVHGLSRSRFSRQC